MKHFLKLLVSFQPFITFMMQFQDFFAGCIFGESAITGSGSRLYALCREGKIIINGIKHKMGRVWTRKCSALVLLIFSFKIHLG